MTERRVLLIAEEFSEQPDEGVLNVLDQMLVYLHARTELLAIHCRGSVPTRYASRRMQISRLRPNRAMLGAIRDFAPTEVLYVPSASVTPAALARGALLERAIHPVAFALLGLQRRSYSGWGGWMAGRLHPRLVLVNSSAAAAVLARIGVPATPIRLGVDGQRFTPADDEERQELREKLGLQRSDRIFLHVGHLRGGRGLHALEDLAEDPDWHGLMIASPTTPEDPTLRQALEESGVRVLREHLPNVADYYRAADVYVFPVDHAEAAIEFPLSVLEAMSCGLPVVTTRFGALPEMFGAVEGVHFWDGQSSIRELVSRAVREPSRTREAVQGKSWTACFDELFGIVERGGAGS